MSTDPFAASRQSLARAEARLELLRAGAEAFFAAHPYSIVAAPHDELPGHGLCRFRLVKPVPFRANRLAGQVAWALHRSLDQLGPEATVALGARPARFGNRFPFASSAAAFKATINRCCWRVAPEIVELFMACAAHPGGDDLLYALHQICRLSKRRLLVPEVSARMVLAMDGKTHVQPAALHAPEWNAARREVTLVHYDPDGLFAGKAQVTFFFAFGGLPALRSYSAVAVLSAQLEKVKAIMAAAERVAAGEAAEAAPAPESAAGYR